jgi:hypothetical protein
MGNEIITTKDHKAKIQFRTRKLEVQLIKIAGKRETHDEFNMLEIFFLTLTMKNIIRILIGKNFKNFKKRRTMVLN